MLNIVFLFSIILFLSCAEPPPEETQVVMEGKDINSSDVMVAGEEPYEPVVDPIDPGYTDADPVDIPDEEELSSFRMKAYLYYYPYENISSSVVMTNSLKLQIPKKIHLLTDDFSIEDGQIASLRYNTTEYCYSGIISTDIDTPSYFALYAYKEYEPDHQCVDELMQLDYLGVTAGPVTLMENGKAYIAESKNTIMSYGYMRYQGEAARFSTELLNSSMYFGSSKLTGPDVTNGVNWNYAFQISFVGTTKFQILALANVDVYSSGKVYFLGSSVVKFRFRGDNRIELLVNNEVAGITDSNFYTEQSLDFAVKEAHNVIPLVSPAVTANLPDQLEAKDAPTVDAIPGDIFELKNSRNSNKDSSIIKVRLKEVE